uniref:Centrosomal protein POC5 n=1 Tax=Biomphalaria glabrata TaxID=6526 RepID=A0A2C9L5P1_BIOGL
MSHNVNANANQNQDFLQSYKHDGSLKSLPADLSNVPDLASRQAQSLPVFASSYEQKHFTEKIATNFHDNQLTRKVLKCWFGTIQQRWKERTEKICESKAQNICSGIVGDYEEKIKCLNQHISCLEDKIQTLQCEQEQYSQQVKKAFMRGVCALNMEAMSAFGTEDTCAKGKILCSEKERLQKEVNRLSEMLCTMEKSLARKDTVIENLTGALAKEKEKLHLAKAFYSCKEKALDKKRE